MNNENNANKSKQSEARVGDNRRPATEIMKKVATKIATVDNAKKLEKVFSSMETEEILKRREAGEALNQVEHRAIAEERRRLKKRVKELEKGNKGKLIAMPSIKGAAGFYKMYDFSALYYVYRLADRMGRNARLMSDNDKFSKMLHVASLVDIEKFIEQFKRLENQIIELTDDGIYIFTLKKELSDDELAELRLVEETRRESLYNTLKPKRMDPAIFQGILTVVRQVGPRAKKLERHDYYAIGESMLIDLKDLLRVYFDYTRGILDKVVARNQIIMLIDDLFAGLTVLSEMRIWDFGAAAAIGDNINEVRRLAMREFGIEES